MKTKIGKLALPLPSKSAKATSLEDGSLRILDALPRAEHAALWQGIANEIEAGSLERPAFVVLAMSEGDDVRTSIPDEDDEGFGPKSAAQLFLALTTLNENTKVKAVGFDLACGCGLRVEVTP